MRRPRLAVPALVTMSLSGKRRKKALLAAPLRLLLRSSYWVREPMRRLCCHAALAARLKNPLPDTVVVLGRCWVFGTGNLYFGSNAYLYPHLHFETQGAASIRLGERVVLSRGVHLVAMAGITIGDGTMIGEYTSIRDANHRRREGISIRDAGYEAAAVTIGPEVWIGRGVTVLAGVTIGRGATIGANAVVTRDVPAGTVVGGVPAIPLGKRSTKSRLPDNSP